MSKLMTVDILSSIKGAKPSEAVNKLFEVIKSADSSSDNSFTKSTVNYVTLDGLRDDVVIHSSEMEKQIIKENFPKEMKGYLVVSKVIED